MIKGYVITDAEGDFFNLSIHDGYVQLNKCSVKDALYFIDFLQARSEVEWLNEVRRDGRLKKIDIPFPLKIENTY